jgi:hypothetical protein
MTSQGTGTESLIDRVTEPALAFYRRAVRLMQASGIPHAVGGAFALEHHTGVARWTKDLDLFVRPDDCPQALRLFKEAGYHTELRFPHWLGKVISGEYVIDVIFNSGNGLCTVDDAWFQHAVPGRTCGLRVEFVPPEEMIWSKAFVMERERYDGADIAHLLHACAKTLDWPRLLHRFGANWRVLLSHLTLFGFIYPARRLQVPDWIMGELLRRLQVEMRCLPSDQRVCQGTLLSWSQYLIHTERGEYRDARHPPYGVLSEADTALVTETLAREMKN